MSSCGAETHLLFSGHSAIDASDTSARTAPGVRVGQPAPKAASKVSHEARRSSKKCVGSHASQPPQSPITNRHDSSWFESFRSHFALFWSWSFWLAISEPGWTSRKKVSLGIRLKSTRPSCVVRVCSMPNPPQAGPKNRRPRLSHTHAGAAMHNACMAKGGREGTCTTTIRYQRSTVLCSVLRSRGRGSASGY